MNSLRGGSPMIGLQHAPRFGGVSCIAVPSLTSLATCGVERSGYRRKRGALDGVSWV